MAAQQGPGPAMSAEPTAPPPDPGQPAVMDFKDSSHGAYLHEGVCKLWITKEHADIVLAAGSTRIPCHRVLLCIQSTHLQRRLSTQGSVATLTEDSQESLPVLRLSEIPGDLLSDILQYIYTGQVMITAKTVQGMLASAKLLELHGLVMLCTVFMAKNISVENVLDVLEAAGMVGLKSVEDKALGFVIEHFMDFMEQWRIQQKFNHISSRHLCAILKSSKLNVVSEDDVCMAVLEWFKYDHIKRMPDIYEVFRHVRLIFVDPVTIAHLQTETLLLPERRCQELFQQVESSVTAGYFPSDLVSSVPRKSYNFVTCMIFPDKPPSVRLVKFGGTITERALHHVSNVPWVANGCIKVCCRAGTDVYVSGVGDHGKEVWKFDTNTMDWAQCPSLNIGRRQNGLVATNTHLYAVAGSAMQPVTVLSNIECLRLNSNESWSKTPRGLIHRVRRCACVARGSLIYVLGGQDAMDRTCDYLQVFNTDTEQCKSNLPRLPVAMTDGYAVVWRNQIFLLGRGVFFIYNIEYALWTTTTLGMTMSHFGCVLHASSLYIFGGFIYEAGRSTCTNSVFSIKVKDILKNHRAWNKVGQMDTPMCVYSATAIGFLREYSSVPALSRIMPPAATMGGVEEEMFELARQQSLQEQDNNDDALPSYEDVLQMIAEDELVSSTPRAPSVSPEVRPTFFLSDDVTNSPVQGQVPQQGQIQYLSENAANETVECSRPPRPQSASPRPRDPPPRPSAPPPVRSRDRPPRPRNPPRIPRTNSAPVATDVRDVAAASASRSVPRRGSGSRSSMNGVSASVPPSTAGPSPAVPPTAASSQEGEADADPGRDVQRKMGLVRGDSELDAVYV